MEGGLVGATFALGLDAAGIEAVLIEREVPRTRDTPGPGSARGRAIAVAHGTRLLIEAQQDDRRPWWPAVEVLATPLLRVHVSERGWFGRTVLDAAALGVPALGYVLRAGEMQGAVWERLRAAAAVEVVAPARVRGVRVRQRSAIVELDDGGETSTTLEADLVVAADGAGSALRGRVDRPDSVRSHRHRALIAELVLSAPHRGSAYERFVDGGILALLPLPGRRMGLVATGSAALIDELLAIRPPVFRRRIEGWIEGRGGRIESVAARAAFPLYRVAAGRQAFGRVALIGSAANQLHPVAGQGFNLGARDAGALLSLLRSAEPGADLGSAARMRRFQALRRFDVRATGLFTDGLVCGFGLRAFPAGLARNLAMTALDLVAPANRVFGLAAMGWRVGSPSAFLEGRQAP